MEMYGDEIDGQFLTDSQEIVYILESIGRTDLINEATAIIAKVGDGDFKEVWVTEDSRPYSINAVFERII